MFSQLADAAASNVEALEAQLPEKIMGLDERVSALTATPLADVEKKYSGALTPATPAVNGELAELLSYVRGEAAECVLNLRKIERFIVLHVPKVEDGNNFGVAIQLETNKLVRDSGKEVKALLDALPSYHKERAAAWKEVSVKRSSDSVETTSSSADESKSHKDGESGKGSKSGTSKMTKTTVSTPEPNADALAAVVALDVAQYFAALYALEVVRDAYIHCGDALAKNKEKISCPKGEGGNAMSMF